MAAVDVILGITVLLMPWTAVSAVLVPPVVMAEQGRWSLPGVALWLSGVALAMGWVVASFVEMDRVDASGESGSIFSEVGWLVAAVAAATGSVVLAARRRGVRA